MHDYNHSPQKYSNINTGLSTRSSALPLTNELMDHEGGEDHVFITFKWDLSESLSKQTPVFFPIWKIKSIRNHFLCKFVQAFMLLNVIRERDRTELVKIAPGSWQTSSNKRCFTSAETSPLHNIIPLHYFTSNKPLLSLHSGLNLFFFFIKWKQIYKTTNKCLLRVILIFHP